MNTDFNGRAHVLSASPITMQLSLSRPRVGYLLPAADRHGSETGQMFTIRLRNKTKEWRNAEAPRHSAADAATKNAPRKILPKMRSFSR